MNGRCRKLKQNFEGLKFETLKHPSFSMTQVLSILESPLSLISALVLGMLELILLFPADPNFEHIRTSFLASYMDWSWGRMSSWASSWEFFWARANSRPRLSYMPCLFAWSGVFTYSGKCMGLSGSVLCTLKVHVLSMSGPVLSLRFFFWHIFSLFSWKWRLQWYV